MTRTAPAAIYFLSTKLSDDSIITVSRVGTQYLICGGLGRHPVRYQVADTSPKQVDERLATEVGHVEIAIAYAATCERVFEKRWAARNAA